MKILDVASLVTLIEGTITKVNNQEEAVEKIYQNMQKLVGLDREFSGKGAESIKSFFKESHMPFLKYYDKLLGNYRRVLNGVLDAYPEVEPQKDGVVREEFLELEREQLKTQKTKVINLIDDFNEQLAKIRDNEEISKVSDDNYVETIKDLRHGLKENKEKLHNLMKTKKRT
ncbi:T7SS effector LXG polymorphic toxin [Bacillus massilinigeriensis]|uniref:T7SS effector LXG polymorphic toxin n=1 Tax=Bacillus mediterraneensis TaxID=1805474 RepID=UPI0008F8E4E9|nr:T7SS effector LXG polymorphic toxin [Bacillus mediterraneensis]